MSCEYCTFKANLINGDEVMVYIDSGELCAQTGPYTYESKEIPFCPMCGKPLVKQEPLTLDELRGMDGEPVWLRHGDGTELYTFVEVQGDSITLIGVYDIVNVDPVFYAMYYDDPDGHFGLHILGWLAYRRKPEED